MRTTSTFLTKPPPWDILGGMWRWLKRENGNYLPPVRRGDGPPTRVFVAVSGGVDSSVSAALLNKRGYEVTGVFIKTYYPPEIECRWREERLDALRVCEHLQIPFRDCDLEETYKKHVFDTMLASYQAGVTPNPDVWCNSYVKFGGFLAWARKQGADYVATGHYAQHHCQGDRHYLVMGRDKNKDQSYFLHQLQQHQLARALFPVGDLSKKRVRKIAQRYALFTAEKQDSQGLCFVGPVQMQDFLRHYLQEQPGEVLDTHGQVIGEHQGSFFLTIGQRTGFEIFPQHRSSHMPRLFVVAKDSERNTVTVSPHRQEGETIILTLTQTSWVGEAMKPGEQAESRIRHRGELLPAVLTSVEGDHSVFTLETPHRGVAPGQSLVLYREGRCLGGGIISSGLN